MNEKKLNAVSVLVVGNGNLTYSIAVCLVKAKCMVDLCTDDVYDATGIIQTHLSEMKDGDIKTMIDGDDLRISQNIGTGKYALAIVITPEEPGIKKDTISRLEKILSPDTPIVVNTESIGLDIIQEGAVHPERVIGLNWTEPAHTTRFMEIITNPVVKTGLTDQINILAASWNKDPYIVENLGIRSKMMGAMIREAFYLIENGYASVEDIDRACRNDAGYYLPFAGNCRYMDLMGTYAYGMVMKNLNPDLSKEQQLPDFFKEIIEKGGLGMQNGAGVYQYTSDEVGVWRKLFNEFSYQIEEIINKYPFKYKRET